MSDENKNFDNWNDDRRQGWDVSGSRGRPRFSHGGIYAGHNGSHNHAVIGAIILVIGILFLLRNLGIFLFTSIWHFWPAILIIIGIAKIFESRDFRRVLSGVIIAVVGAIFLANNLGYISWGVWRLLWPVLVIGFGLIMVLRGFGRKGSRSGARSFIDNASATSDNMLKEMVVFGGIHRKFETQDFQGGEVSAVFGGAEIDLRGAGTTRDVVEIEADAVFGGVELKVPDS
jgi:hypothetical protein